MAVFSSIDVDPGFDMKLCNDASLFDAVHLATFIGAPTDETRAEVEGIVDLLRADGDVHYADGWISLRLGMAAVATFLLAKLEEARRDERWADEQRFEELKLKQAAEARYDRLRQALREALGGDGAAEITRAVA